MSVFAFILSLSGLNQFSSLGSNTGTQEEAQCEERLPKHADGIRALPFPLSPSSLVFLCSLTLTLHLGLEKAGWLVVP